MTHEQWYSKCTPAQRNALRALVGIHKPDDFDVERKEALATLVEKSFAPTSLTPYIGVPDHKGIFIGIERDGYTHS